MIDEFHWCDLRSSGSLPVREHLRPKPHPKAFCEVLVYSRNKFGGSAPELVTVDNTDQVLRWGEA